jgi:hypothetical protein
MLPGKPLPKLLPLQQSQRPMPSRSPERTITTTGGIITAVPSRENKIFGALLFAARLCLYKKTVSF